MRVSPINSPKCGYSVKKVSSFGKKQVIYGDQINDLIADSMEKGYVAFEYSKRNQRNYIGVRDSFFVKCREEGKVFIEVFVKGNVAFARFDAITIPLPYDQRELPFKKWFLESKLESYYESLDTKTRNSLLLPAELSPYSHAYHKLNFWIMPKQAVISFLVDESEIFEYALKKSMKI